jgi:hypothetical protein
VLERPGILPPRLHDRRLRRHHHVYPRLISLCRLLEENRDAVGVRIRQRMQQEIVDDTEHGCVRADTEGEREDGDGRPGFLAPERADSEAHVLGKGVEQLRAGHAAFSPCGNREACGAIRR